MPLLTTVLLSSSRYSQRITSVLYISTYCFNIAARQWMDMNVSDSTLGFLAILGGQSWVIISLSRSSSSKTLTSWHWTLLRCETSEGRGEVSVTRDARRRRGERRGGECLHFCLWTGDWREERGRGPERLSLMMDSHRRDRGGATQEDSGVSCDKIPGIQVIKLIS